MIPRPLIIAVSVMLVIVVAMGIYVRRMTRRAGEVQPSAADTRPVPPPPVGPTEAVTLYVADDVSGMLHPRSAQIPLPGGRQQRAEEVLAALLRLYQRPDSPHPLAVAAEIRSVYLVDPGLAVIDVNAAFADQHRSGILDEQLTVNSLVQTLATNVVGVNRVRILVEGRTRDTLAGHADLSEVFDAANVAAAQ